MKYFIVLPVILFACGADPAGKMYSNYTENEDAGELYTADKLTPDATTINGNACLNHTSINDYRINSTTWMSGFFPIDSFGRSFSFKAPTTGDWVFNCAVKSNLTLTYQTSTQVCFGPKMSLDVSVPLTLSFHTVTEKQLSAGDVLWIEMWADKGSSIACEAVLKI